MELESNEIVIAKGNLSSPGTGQTSLQNSGLQLAATASTLRPKRSGNELCILIETQNNVPF